MYRVFVCMYIWKMELELITDIILRLHIQLCRFHCNIAHLHINSNYCSFNYTTCILSGIV